MRICTFSLTHTHTHECTLLHALYLVFRYHWEQLAEDNGADPDGTRVVSVTQIQAQEAPVLPDTLPNATKWLLCGEQVVAKFNEAAKNRVEIQLLLLRLPQQHTDILVTFNHAAYIAPESSSRAPDAPPLSHDEARVLMCSIAIHDVSLFDS